MTVGAYDEGQPMSEDTPEYGHGREPGRPLEENLKARSTWMRLLFMIVMTVCYAVARLVIGVVVVLQFLHVLFTGETNPRLKDLGLSLARYDYQIVEYLTFNTETRPFPFDAEWPPAQRE
jgi:Domain of unknown function (DUF4389)